MTVSQAVTPALLTKVWTKIKDHLYIWRDMKERDTVIPCFTGLCSYKARTCTTKINFQFLPVLKVLFGF
jgi:hypothetical protein